MSTADLTEAATSRYAQAGPIRVHYNEAGTGTPLIFLEGQGAGTSAWVVYHRVLPLLAPHVRCLLLDQPGYGKSDPVVVRGESRSTMYARTVRDFMNALELEQAVLVDMSFGAQTAQAFAIDHPGRASKLVLHASGAGGTTLFGHPPEVSHAFIEMNRAFAAPSLETLRSMMHAFLYDGARYGDDELMLTARLDAWRSRPELEAARRASENVRRDLTAELCTITQPVLQLHGRNDLIAPLESALRLLSALPDARLLVFNRCGHWIPFERPAEFARATLDFITNAGSTPC
jgi:2-hydroxy-6-oxonona-2,4-dienedioate hydrolase